MLSLILYSLNCIIFIIPRYHWKNYSQRIHHQIQLSSPETVDIQTKFMTFSYQKSKMFCIFFYFLSFVMMKVAVSLSDCFVHSMSKSAMDYRRFVLNLGLKRDIYLITHWNISLISSLHFKFATHEVFKLNEVNN